MKDDEYWVPEHVRAYLAGFGISYFDFDNAGYVKTATEVSSDNSALMRNIRRHENALQGSITSICTLLSN